MKCILCHLPHSSRLSRLALWRRLLDAEPLMPPVTLQPTEQADTKLQLPQCEVTHL